MAEKLPFYAPKNGFAVTYNRHLALCRDPVLAKKRAAAEWESLSPWEKDARQSAAKSEWAKEHPPAEPKPETEEEKKW